MKLKYQRDVKDCGLVVIQGFFRFFYKLWIPIEHLKYEANFGKNGISLENLSILAKKYKLKTEILKGSFEALKEAQFKFPIGVMIESEGLNHLVVLEKIKRHKIIYRDPIVGRVINTFEEFSKKYLGFVIVFEPQLEKLSNAFRLPKLEHNLKISFPKSLKIAIIFVHLTLLCFELISSFYLKMVFETTYLLKNFSLLFKITLFFMGILFLKFLVKTLKDVWYFKTTNLLEAKLLKQFWNRISNLPSALSKKFSKADVFRRFSYIDSLTVFKVSKWTILFGDLLTIFPLLIILFFINIKLALVSLIFMIIYFGIMMLVTSSKNKKIKTLIIESKNHIDRNWDFIFLDSQLRQQKKKSYYQRLCFKQFQSYSKERQKLNFLEFLLNNLTSFFALALPLAINYFGFVGIFSSQLQLSDLFLFTSLLQFCFLSLQSLTNHLNSFLQNHNNLDEFKVLFLGYKQRSQKNPQALRKIISFEIKDFVIITQVPILKIPFLSFSSNKIIEGGNGIGKSLLLKTLNFEQEFEGDILVNGESFKKFDLQNLKQRIIKINSDDFLPSVSISEFLLLGDSNATRIFLEQFKRYDLATFLNRNGLSLETRILDGGSNFSLGQKQIIRVLQLFTAYYDLILLDETFDNIDQNNFEFLKKCILDFQKGAVFVEISHNDRFLFPKSRRINLEEFQF